MMDTGLRQLGLRDRQIDGARIEWILVNDRPIVSTGPICSTQIIK